ncbi:uncharacterized acyltransferase C428.14-like [Lotus japonicus]|uniref:uncharacterized acyltransferase C428.14-like n=1 Tax=Lotus japonicus TaxID=34305 RepID=UPI0025834B2C|nr:uncharacterized acyltransferase C428.14-like [Lotus japonicus]
MVLLEQLIKLCRKDNGNCAGRFLILPLWKHYLVASDALFLKSLFNIIQQRSGCLGSTLAVMKKSSKFLPVIGWSIWFSEYLLLERSWAKDKSTLKSSLRRLSDFPLPFWLALFVEGTCFTQDKLLVAQEYATSTGLPVHMNMSKNLTNRLEQNIRQQLQDILLEANDYMKSRLSKTILYEYVVKMKVGMPTYQTSRQEGLRGRYVSFVAVNGINYTGDATD